jgi:hypothetical protein
MIYNISWLEYKKREARDCFGYMSANLYFKIVIQRPLPYGIFKSRRCDTRPSTLFPNFQHFFRHRQFLEVDFSKISTFQKYQLFKNIKKYLDFDKSISYIAS